MSPKSDYPGRPQFFAHRYCRLLTKTCAAQEIGHVAFTLCVTIALQEDAKRYKGPVTYWNNQLLPIIGVRKWDTMDVARKRAVEAGWLHYESGGKHRVGKYWVTIPDGLDDLDDSPCDESLYPKNGEEDESQSPSNGDKTGDKTGDPSTLTLNPDPDPKEPASAAAIPGGLLELIAGWNKLPPEVVKKGNGAWHNPPSKAAQEGWKKAQKEPEQREAFEDIPALLEAIKRAKYCHRKGWFTVPWLFGKNKCREFNVSQTLNGAHDDDDRPDQTRPRRPVRPTPSVARPKQRYGEGGSASATDAAKT